MYEGDRHTGRYYGHSEGMAVEINAAVVELVYTRDLRSCASWIKGSSPFGGTKNPIGQAGVCVV